MQLISFAQTCPPAEDDDQDSDGTRNRSTASSEDDSSGDDNGDGAVQRKRRRKSMSILCKQDRMPKQLAPKRGNISKVKKVGTGAGGGGLVRVRRSSLIKALSQPGRAIGVKDSSGKDAGVKESTGVAKDAAVRVASNTLSNSMGKDREGKAEAKTKKPQANQDRMPPASAGTAVKSGSTSMVGGSKKRDARDPDNSVKGTEIATLARALTDLADRIPYMGVHTSAPKVWSDFNAKLANVTTVAGIRKQWLWLTRQVWACARETWRKVMCQCLLISDLSPHIHFLFDHALFWVFFFTSAPCLVHHHFHSISVLLLLLLPNTTLLLYLLLSSEM